MNENIYKWFFPLLILTIISCTPSDEEKQEIAIITCNIIAESRNMDSVIRLTEINKARKELGEDPFLGSDDDIKVAYEYGLCKELVLNDPSYDNLLSLKIERERQMIERERQKDPRYLEGLENRQEAETFLAENGQRPEVTTTESGLQYEVLEEGTGDSPVATDEVEVHYSGTLLDGRKFDSSYDRGQTLVFPLNGVIAGWTEGLQYMKEGAKYKFYIPADLGYGDNPRPGGIIEPGSMLIFEVELIDVK